MSISSPTLSSKLLRTFLSFNFHFLLLPTLLIVLLIFSFLLFISAITSAYCEYPGIALTSFKYFLPFLLTYTKSISVLLYFLQICMFFSLLMFSCMHVFFPHFSSTKYLQYIILFHRKTLATFFFP